ncbi:hypothetical protein M422DRAFT_245055 [Sphaerobolus stellatus SS14]|nr:hypothetical protein M422DRAFT_245055 [Sphaerobolus stellatus SS14]
MNFQPPVTWGDSASQWAPNFSSQSSRMFDPPLAWFSLKHRKEPNYQQGSHHSSPPLSPSSPSYDPYGHISSDYPLIGQHRSLPTVPSHGHSHYSSPNQYPQVPSSVPPHATGSMQRFHSQFSTSSYPEGYQSLPNDDSSVGSAGDVVHAYRRLSPEEEQMSESSFGESNSSNRKKSGGQNQSSRQQLPAKFECVAWSVFGGFRYLSSD